jgi:hypothetical protein
MGLTRFRGRFDYAARVLNADTVDYRTLRCNRTTPSWRRRSSRTGPQLAFHRREEALHDGVVPAIASSAHAAHDARGRQARLVVLAGIRAPLVGVVQEAAARAAAFERHVQGLQREVAIIDGAHCPPAHVPREEVQHDRQVELAAGANHKLGRVSDPALIGGHGLELPIEDVGCDRLIVLAHRGVLVPTALSGLQPVFLHQPHDALSTHVLLELDQVLVDPRAPVPLLALRKGGLHEDLQATVVARVAGFRARLPRVEPTARDTQAPTENRYGMLGLLRRDAGKPYRLCFATYAAALFKISRSSWTMRNSLRSRTNSSRSSFMSPLLPFVRSA